MACAARAASQVAMGSIDDVRSAVQFATGVSILSREKKTALLKVKGYAIIKRFVGSNQQKLQRLLNELELGDSKPSQLLRRMRQLWCGGGTDDAILRELFLQRLPGNVRMVLAPSASSITLDNLAEMADRIMELSTPSIAAIHAPSVSSLSEIDSLRAEVRQLKELVQSLSLYSRSRDPRHRSPTPARQRSPSPAHHTPVSDDSTICWYHQRFGNAATKCRPPC